MKWAKNHLVVIVTLAALGGGGLVTWGRMQQLCTQIDGKADKEDVIAAMYSDRQSITRELDMIQKHLEAINARLDGVVVRQAIIQPTNQP